MHSASLIIDDIEDDSAIRRGDEAIHRRYGLDVAISAANTAYFLPMLAVLDHSILTSEEKQAACEAYQRQVVRAHLGQSLDLYWTRNLTEVRLETWMADSLRPKLLQMYALKTAAPLECLASVGLLLARADESTRRAVLAFVRSFGLAFQLIDDVNNFSDSPAWRKERGEDLMSGKLTYLILCALERLPETDSALLRRILCQPDLRRDQHFLNIGIELIMHSGACEYVRNEARDLLVPAWEETSHVVPASISKMELRFLWEGLIGLSSEPRDGLHL
jgi:geranylgeranyl pyrophosphate synthase